MTEAEEKVACALESVNHQIGFLQGTISLLESQGVVSRGMDNLTELLASLVRLRSGLRTNDWSPHV